MTKYGEGGGIDVVLKDTLTKFWSEEKFEHGLTLESGPSGLAIFLI